MTTPTPDAPYTLRHVREMLGLGRGVIEGLIAAGYVAPERGLRNELRFSFQDMVLLRTAHQLREARVPTRRLLRSLRELKARLPSEMPLAGLRIRAAGNDIAVRHSDANWEAPTGQLLLDFEIQSSAGTVSFLQRATPAAVALHVASAEDWFDEGELLEGRDNTAAEAAYRHVLALAPAHADAALNLGAMLCEAGRCDEALALYDRAVTLSPGAPLLHFNRAIALEDRGREVEALRSYERALELAPALADAHYNVARLHDRLGDPRAALRHYSAYRRMTHDA